MNISILTTATKHPVHAHLERWMAENAEHKVSMFHSSDQITSGDILFLVSCSEILPISQRKEFKKVLVIHASNLPYGRGWSPHIWAIINGATEITLSLLEAEDSVDTGNIWRQVSIPVPKTAIFNEINELIFSAELKLMDYAVKNFYTVEPERQPDIYTRPWPKRSPKDSLVDINQTIDSQFDLIRVCDPNRFPAYFYKNGVRFNIKIEKHHE